MYLETAYLFQGMSEETRGKILDAATEESHAQGAFIFRRGEAATHFYILSEGRVRLSVGHKELLAYVASDPGDVLGWSSLVENETYTASAECLVPVKVLKTSSSSSSRPLSGTRSSATSPCSFSCERVRRFSSRQVS